MSPAERARKNESAILQAMSAMGQNELARAMGANESTISRMKGEQLATFATLLAHLGLKVTNQGMVCFDPAYVEALRTLAARGIGTEPPRLDWSDVQ